MDAKPRELLLYLLCHPQGRTREQAGLVFWPDASTAQVKNSFHVLLHRLRKSLGDAARVVLDDERYRVDPEPSVWFDAAVFEREVPAALQDETVGDWHLEIHDRLRRLYVDALSALADRWIGRGEHARAIPVLERLVVKENLSEDAHRRLMLALAKTGQRDRALRHYERLSALLREELDAAPEPETAVLLDSIRRGEVSRAER
jgi:DNA-binding SARP family transcriptional activator